LFEDGHDLAIGKAGGFHRISFKSNNVEILLLSQVKGWGYYLGILFQVEFNLKRELNLSKLYSLLEVTIPWK